MATFSDHRYYKDGTGGVSSVIGYESKANRVLRVSFTTGACVIPGCQMSTADLKKPKQRERKTDRVSEVWQRSWIRTTQIRCPC